MTLVNFTVTPLGLEDQLLSLVIRKERPDLAARKAAVIHQGNEFKVRIKQLEDDILVKLSTAEGDITEDRALIEGLESAKQQSLDASARLEEGKQITTSINETAERYRGVAKRGATIFFLMNSLHRIHTYLHRVLFSYSMQWPSLSSVTWKQVLHLQLECVRGHVPARN